MDELTQKAVEYALKLGISLAVAVDPKLLEPEPRIRAFCAENKCGSYNSNYSCPPFVGPLDEIRERIRTFQRGVLLQYTREVVIKKGSQELAKTKSDFHSKVLQMEEFLKSEGIEKMWGMLGGNCGLCNACRARTGELCAYPERARNSLEAAGIDVLSLLEKLGLDNKFYPDRIKWTGCVLF